MPSERSFDDSNRKALLKFNGESKKDLWGQQRYCYVKEPRIPRGDFAGFSIQCLAVRVEAFGKAGLASFFNNYVAELLPLVDENDQTEWYAINMMHLVNCVDREKSELSVMPFRRRLEFFPQRVSQQNVFTPWWPQSFWRKVLCWERHNDRHSEFKACVEQLGLTGLEFELLWDEERGGRLFLAESDPEKGIVIRNQDDKPPDPPNT
jgi:hypothetical protein